MLDTLCCTMCGAASQLNGKSNLHCVHRYTTDVCAGCRGCRFCKRLPNSHARKRCLFVRTGIFGFVMPALCRCIKPAHRCSFPEVWHWVLLCLPPADPANPAKNDIKADTADCRVFQECAADVSESSSLISFVGGPEEITQEVRVRKPQEAVDLVRCLCGTRGEEPCR